MALLISPGLSPSDNQIVTIYDHNKFISPAHFLTTPGANQSVLFPKRPSFELQMHQISAPDSGYVVKAGEAFQAIGNVPMRGS